MKYSSVNDMVFIGVGAIIVLVTRSPSEEMISHSAHAMTLNSMSDPLQFTPNEQHNRIPDFRKLFTQYGSICIVSWEGIARLVRIGLGIGIGEIQI